MFVKNLLQKAVGQTTQHGNMTLENQYFQVAMHYGVPYTSSILAFDSFQRLLAIGTLDGRIKIIGGDNIEGLLLSPKKVPYKYLEFLHNKGLLICISNENDIQVWDLQCRNLAYSLQWEANITAFAVISGSYLMYVGDENGLLSVLKYDVDEEKLLNMPYNIPAKSLSGSVGVFIPDQHQIVGILPQPGTSGSRVLIAYENGVIILWDICESNAITVRTSSDLQLKAKECNSSISEASNDPPDTVADEQENTEICSICWASNSGSILAVGYINGDILLWDLSISSSVKGKESSAASKSVVKLQLASGDRRLPVIVLHWCANVKANNDKGGQLFVYGGDDMGSEEVITVLNLEWSNGIDNVRCISRAELNLDGSFADMILVPDAGPKHNSTAALFVLTNPGQINVYDGATLSILKSAEGEACAHPQKFPVIVPTIDPCITIAKLCLLTSGKNSLKALLKKAFTKKTETPTLSAGTKWPLTGGVPGEKIVSGDDSIERLYIAGYQDGSVRIWDATHPILRLLFVLDWKVPGIEIDGLSASVSALDFCSWTMSLVVGNDRGLVRVYKLQGATNEPSFHLINGNKCEVHNVHQAGGFYYAAVFSSLNSPIRILQFASGGVKFAAGLENGQVAMMDISSYVISFNTGCLSSSGSQVISMTLQVIPQINTMISNLKHSRSENMKEISEALLFILTKDGHVIVLDSLSGNMLSPQPMHTRRESAAISMYVIDGTVPEMPGEKPRGLDDHSSNVHSKNGEDTRARAQESEETHVDASKSIELLADPFLLLCFEDSLRLYSLKSVIQGEANLYRKVNLSKHCCWSATFKKRDEISWGLILLYQTGDVEIRSLPDLEVVAGSSLMSVLRWNFKTNMEKTMSSYDKGQITLVNGNEVAFISLLACENDLRIPESLPSLHDKVLAAASDAAIALHASHRKKQDIINGFIKGLKGGKAENSSDIPESIVRSSCDKLEDYFLKVPFSNPSTSTTDKQEVELSIDDINIDDNPSAVPSSSVVLDSSSDGRKHKKREENKEREKLFEGSTTDMKPRIRTTQEIMTKYKFGGDAAAAAAHARDKLAERQDKLERIRKNTEELQSGAENFASLANELVKTMENRKWWQM
ncbi:hypothetical protein AXF42_Ash012279 [Apostasia shenzhenica]|uniref:V-SNARE coiled-coil homology domain-containing protein n=1 Tax=Apostasia shenzhenica TaxID=1088818 RepID=A0A2I0B4H3_9ASPA|nr:hypothetical protein AXF42_Ash012279 [Apostasia shenzhenica]